MTRGAGRVRPLPPRPAPPRPAPPDPQNSELLTLTYGAIVTQIVRDYEDPREVNAQLELMGYNIGVRLVDEFCAKSRGVRCRSFRESMETVARDAFKMFLGVTASIDGFTADGNACTLRLADNPLAGAFARARRAARAGASELPRRPRAPARPSTHVLTHAPPVPVRPPRRADFVELPPAFSELRYSNILCGVIRGALEMVSLRVTCTFTKDALNGDDATEIRVALQEVLQEGAGQAYDDER